MEAIGSNNLGVRCTGLSIFVLRMEPEAGLPNLESALTVGSQSDVNRNHQQRATQILADALIELRLKNCWAPFKHENFFSSRRSKLA